MQFFQQIFSTTLTTKLYYYFAQGLVDSMLEQDYHSQLISVYGTESCFQAFSLYPS